MPAYNAERTIAGSVNSVIAQTYANWELIIIIDSSKDRTLKIVEELAGGDPRVRYQLSEERAGIASARNRGIELSKGDCLAFLDADDLWREDKLERQLEFMENRNAKISYTASAFMNSEGSRYDYVMPAIEKLSYRELLKRNIMSCSSVMVKKELAAQYRFDEGNLSEDFLLWLQIVKATGAAYGLNEPLLVYRLSSGSNSANRLGAAASTYNTYRKIGCSPAGSAFRTVNYFLYSIAKRRRIHKESAALEVTDDNYKNPVQS
jgi:teichuronic acid biosynthesis glycosyltransferase TuaG